MLPSSCHKLSGVRSLVYSLALRIRRIYSSEEAAERRYKELEEILQERKYSEAVIKAGISRANTVPRTEALKKVDKQQEKGRKEREHRLIVE